MAHVVSRQTQSSIRAFPDLAIRGMARSGFRIFTRCPGKGHHEGGRCLGGRKIACTKGRAGMIETPVQLKTSFKQKLQICVAGMTFSLFLQAGKILAGRTLEAAMQAATM